MDPLYSDLTRINIGGVVVASAMSKRGISRRYPMPMPTLLNPSIALTLVITKLASQDKYKDYNIQELYNSSKQRALV